MRNSPGPSVDEGAKMTLVIGPPGRASLACFGVNLAAFAALVGMVVSSRQPLWKDEVWYLAAVAPLLRSGPTFDWLRTLPGPAGPLHAWAHAMFEPLTRLQPPGVRLLNIGLFVLAVGALGGVMRRRGIDRPWMVAAGILSAPMMFGVIGTAITEIPAMLFFALQLWLLIAAFEQVSGEPPGDRRLAVPLAALAGLSFGLAFSGRQQYLLSLPAALVLGWRNRAFLPPLAAYFVTALLVPSWLFAAWGGLSPPSTAYVGSGVSIPHLLMSFAYAGMVYSIYDVRLLTANWKLSLVLIVAVTAVNIGAGVLTHMPMQELALRFIPIALQPLLSRAACGLMMGFGLIFLVDLTRTLVDRRNRDDRILLYMILAGMLMLSAPAKVTHMFAGRYIIQALPLILVIVSECSPDTYGKALRMGVGCLVGLLSLSAYLGMTV